MSVSVSKPLPGNSSFSEYSAPPEAPLLLPANTRRSGVRRALKPLKARYN